jgi:hypothetical protein
VRQAFDVVEDKDLSHPYGERLERALEADGLVLAPGLPARGGS